MPRKRVLIDLLQQEERLNPNVSLLKKYLLCIHYGWFRINSCSPDKQFALGDYLLDDERVVFDFSRLSEESKEAFLNWFKTPHEEDAVRAFLSGVKTTEYRGYTAEVGLSWWGRITNLLFYKKKSYQWELAPLDLLLNTQLKLNYQLNGLEICEGDRGLLIGFNQLGELSYRGKYQAPEEPMESPLGNTKRLYLTNDLVTKLIALNPSQIDFRPIVSNPHPYAISVHEPYERYQTMQTYRQTQRFIMPQPWYQRLWRWIVSWFVTKEQQAVQPRAARDTDYVMLDRKDTVSIYQRRNHPDVVIVEKRPELNSMVFAGGGAKIFGHVGANAAFEDAHIKGNQFAGSSAGAIMALLNYLGYTTTEILEFFQGFREDNLVHYNIDRSGLSDTRAVRAALDFMIVKKINQLIERYQINSTPEGQWFLDNKVFNNGKITFESLHELKKRYPDSGLGDNLVVTATNMRARRTRYFSHTLTPDTEISEAVTLSASFPVLFKPTIFNGDPHNDGGLINNLPTDVFPDNYSTLLESEHGNCFSLIAFQFDNGVERSLLDQFVDRVYRENFLLNWVLEIVTGVKDTVSFWVKDRLKLLQYSNQTVLIPIGNVSATQLDVDSETQRRLFEQGYEAAENYIKTRYQWDSETDVAAENEEFMYTTFTSIEEAVYFCCHRQNRNWFERLALIANQQGMAIDEINALRSLHFNNPTNLCGVSLDDSEEEIDLGYPTYGLQQNSIFSPHRSVSVRKDELRAKMVSFEKIYPIFLRLPYSFLKNPKDIVTYKKARHSFSLHNLFACAEFLDQIQGEKHILLAGFIHLLKELENPDCDLDELCRRFEDISNILKSEVDLNHASYYGHWSLISRQYFRVFDEFLKGNQEDTITLCHHYSRGEEPMVTFVSNRLVEMSDEDVVSHRSATLM